MPRRVIEAIGKAMKGDQVLAHPDHVARAAYEARMSDTVAAATAAADQAKAAAEDVNAAAEEPEPVVQEPV